MNAMGRGLISLAHIVGTLAHAIEGTLGFFYLFGKFFPMIQPDVDRHSPPVANDRDAW
jgi:hypothetical protein